MPSQVSVSRDVNDFKSKLQDCSIFEGVLQFSCHVLSYLVGFFSLGLTGTVALSWLSGLCVPATPRAMPAGVFTSLGGPPKPERSRSRVQTKDSPTALQAWGLGLRLTTLSCKKNLLRKQQRRQPISCTQTFQGLRTV